MAKALFLYSSREGQTKKIFHYIEEQLTDFECELVDLHNVETMDFSQYEKSAHWCLYSLWSPK